MGKLTNALQGKLNADKGLAKGRSERQLDLFTTLSERGGAEGKPAAVTFKKPAPAADPGPEPEMVLPQSDPPDVSADVRAVLSDSPEPAELAGEDGHPPLRTGIYRRPRRRAVPVAEEGGSGQAPAPRRDHPGARFAPGRLAGRAREWFSGAELDWRMGAMVGAAVLLVAAVAYWSARPGGGDPEPGTTVDLAELRKEAAAAKQEASGPVAGPSAPAAAVAAAPAEEPPAPAQASAGPAPAPAGGKELDLKIAGAEISREGTDYVLKFTDPVFVSADYISPEGMRALKALGAKLAAMPAGGNVTVVGHTDNVPLGRPTTQFRSNADLAKARAKVAGEHLMHFARANQGLAFEMRGGAEGEAPYPNDTPRNRRLNRTATVRIAPAGN